MPPALLGVAGVTAALKSPSQGSAMQERTRDTVSRSSQRWSREVFCGYDLMTARRDDSGFPSSQRWPREVFCGYDPMTARRDASGFQSSQRWSCLPCEGSRHGRCLVTLLPLTINNKMGMVVVIAAHLNAEVVLVALSIVPPPHLLLMVSRSPPVPLRRQAGFTCVINRIRKYWRFGGGGGGGGG